MSRTFRDERHFFQCWRVDAQVHVTRWRVRNGSADRLVGRVVEVRPVPRAALYHDLPAIGDEGFHRVRSERNPRFARARLLVERNFHTSFLAAGRIGPRRSNVTIPLLASVRPRATTIGDGSENTV